MIFWMPPAVFTPFFHLTARISPSDIPASCFITNLDMTVGKFFCFSVLEFVHLGNRSLSPCCAKMVVKLIEGK